MKLHVPKYVDLVELNAFAITTVQIVHISYSHQSDFVFVFTAKLVCVFFYIS